MVLANVTLVLLDRILPNGWIQFSREGIIDLGRDKAPHDPVTIDLAGCFLAPGFIDLHVHGALRRDTMEAKMDAFCQIAGFHASGGTTALALTTIPSELAKTLAVLQAARVFPNSHAGARLLGIHLEGPFLSAEKRGVHRTDLLHAATDANEVEAYLNFAPEITQMTLAPELPGCLGLIEKLVEQQIIVSGGHSDCWAEEAEAAQVAGMSQVTHTYNCMSAARRRGPFREAGLLEYALSEPGIACELIADGRHVSPTLMRALYRAKGKDGIILITDATAGAGLEEGETYFLGETECVVEDGVGMLADRSALAGSTTRMIDGVRNLVQLVDIPLFEAIGMATNNPARALGQEATMGALHSGGRADFVVFTDDFQVRQTWVGGQLVFEG